MVENFFFFHQQENNFQIIGYKAKNLFTTHGNVNDVNKYREEFDARIIFF